MMEQDQKVVSLDMEWDKACINKEAERCGLPPQPVPSRLVGQSKKTKRGRSSPSLLGVRGMCDESLFHKLTCWYRTNDRTLQQLGASHKQVQSASSRGIQQCATNQ
jgi:hypothetical protein